MLAEAAAELTLMQAEDTLQVLAVLVEVVLAALMQMVLLVLRTQEAEVALGEVTIHIAVLAAVLE
jgi:hypothetical protein